MRTIAENGEGSVASERASMDAIRLQSTIAALRPFQSKAAADETEAVMKRMFERAQRWTKR
ncbi:MAG TPA: hypothetical protein VNZ94_17815 [Xanthobacteraceae bacterium]|nr:hypothetical protein [Xanthobacteraceae bacterium]